MANVGGRRGGIRQSTRSRDHPVQEFVPSSAWTEDSDGHYLLVDLPDFNKEEVKLQADNERKITVSGERLVNNNNKYIYFQQTYKIPEDADVENITGNFEEEILYVTVPKLVLERGQAPEGSTADNNVEENPSRDENLKQDTEIPGDGYQYTGKRGNTSTYLDGLHRVILDKLGQEESPLDLAIGMMKNNKGILITAVVAFSIGVLVSRGKYESTGK